MRGFIAVDETMRTNIPHIFAIGDVVGHPAIINPGLAARIGRQKRLELSELGVGQPEVVANHPWSPFGDRESQNHCHRNTFYGSGP
jgi:NADPH-dependent 2,4-dienoyl-CoA reductase/sulfur reductase-like enzyme